MNLAKVIEKVKSEKEGYDVSIEEIIESINYVEMMICEDILKCRKGTEELVGQYLRYDLETDRQTHLIAPDEFCKVYLKYCSAEIDIKFGDDERYAADSSLFNNAYNELKRYFWNKYPQKYSYNYRAR